MSDGNEYTFAITKRWAAVARKPNEAVPRVYQALDDAHLTEVFRQSKQTLAITAHPERKRFDSLPEALRIREMSGEQRKLLRQEALVTATRIRDEFRRRATCAAATD